MGTVYGSLADPTGHSVLVPAVSWIEGTVLGSLATAAAVIATASVGIMMLSGRIDARRGFAVILGSFIVFGAASIAAGLQASIRNTSAMPVDASAPPAPAPTPLADTAPTAPAARDPYAGAAIP